MKAVLRTQKLYKEWICIYSKNVYLSVFLSVWMAALKAVLSHAPNIEQIASLSLVMIQILTVQLEARRLRNLHISAFHQAASATSQACAFKMTCPDLWMTDWTFHSIFSTVACESQGSLGKPWWNHALPFLNSGTTSKNIRSNHAPFKWLGCWVV